jgi:hypothetical protein
MSVTKLAVEDGTIENLKHDSHKRAKCWVAVVEKDKSQPGGLRRTFLDRAPGGRVMAAGIEDGCWLEFAGDYYTCGGRKRADRIYYRVVAANDGELRMEECELSEVGKVLEAEPISPLAAFSDEELLAELSSRGYHGIVDQTKEAVT